MLSSILTVSASLLPGPGCQAGRSKLRTNNQWLSLTDQLRLGVRALELDTHYVQVRGRGLPPLSDGFHRAIMVQRAPLRVAPWTLNAASSNASVDDRRLCTMCLRCKCQT